MTLGKEIKLHEKALDNVISKHICPFCFLDGTRNISTGGWVMYRQCDKCNKIHMINYGDNGGRDSLHQATMLDVHEYMLDTDECYIPKLSEFKLGFAYERLIPSYTVRLGCTVHAQDWKKYVVTERMILGGLYDVNSTLKMGAIRVKRLTSENIKAEGFYYRSTPAQIVDSNGFTETTLNYHELETAEGDIRLSSTAGSNNHFWYVYSNIGSEQPSEYRTLRYAGVIRNQKELNDIVKMVKRSDIMKQNW